MTLVLISQPSNAVRRFRLNREAPLSGQNLRFSSYSEAAAANAAPRHLALLSGVMNLSLGVAIVTCI